MSAGVPAPPLPHVSGRTALVTGANRGLGRAIAVGLARLGHSVLVGVRDRAGGDAVVTEIRAAGGTAETLVLDVSDAGSLAAAAPALRRCDVLVNNAGILPDMGVPALTAPPESLRHIFEVNTLGAVALTQLAAPGMRERRFGRIVNVSSDWGSLAMMQSHQLGYRMSKAALNAATRVFADELREHGVKVNAYHPGWVRTAMGGPNAHRTPEEAADGALWLATLPEDGPTNGFFRDREPHPW